MSKILITGTAGFIGFHLVNKLLKETDWEIIGLDNVNDYYDVKLKFARLTETGIDRAKIENNTITQSYIHSNYCFIKLDLTDKENLINLFKEEKFDYIIHLAAQPGVRYSLENPEAYIESNITGFLNILECCRHYPVKHLVFASSSSVYGNNKKVPFSELDSVDHPISLYAATKKSNELMAHTYSHLFQIPMTGLRFFTVYGPWGRPDMAAFIFARKIMEGEEIEVYNFGEMERDFTFVDDIVGILPKILESPSVGNSDYLSNTDAKFGVYNIGGNNPVKIDYFIQLLEAALGKKARRKFSSIQPGDVKVTYADLEKISNDFGYSPKVNIEEGISKFIHWFERYYADFLDVTEN